MALAKRFQVYNNGLDKKSDGDVNLGEPEWQPSLKMRYTRTVRKRRVFIALVVVALVYLFIKNAPANVPNVGQRIDSRTGLSQARMPLPVQPKPQGKLPDLHPGEELYDGPVRFYNLASTLRNHMYETGAEKDNVAIVLNDLRTTASLIGLACDIGLHNRVSVHVVLLCPQESPIGDIMDISGIKQQDCPIFWHDARPDLSLRSSLTRRIATIQAAMGHIHSYLRPVAVIIDEQQAKDAYFKDALKSKLDQTWTPLSIVPNDALSSMNWIVTLDSIGLSLLNQNQIDIIITPYKYSSGSLMRLLKSIQSAHYTGLPQPRITVEIPSNIDDFALQYLETFRWPADSPVSPSKLILRKRLATTKLSPTAATIRTLESFYPPTYPLSHVLVLDPDVELSPDYLHYLYYLTLEYKYGAKGKDITGSLLGISLGSPALAWKSGGAANTRSDADPRSSPLSLSQSSTSPATLYFGDKWVELQDYVSLRLQHDPDLSIKISKEPENGHISISSNPAWLTLATELMRARNYFTLHPTSSENQEKRLITVHSESHQSPPEVTIPKRPSSNDHIPPPSLAEDTILSSIDTPNQPNSHHPQTFFSSSFLSSLLDKDSKPPGLPIGKEIPLYSHNGELTDWTESSIASTGYAEKISLQVGGCKSLQERDEAKKDHVGYFFCDKEDVE